MEITHLWLCVWINIVVALPVCRNFSKMMVINNWRVHNVSNLSTKKLWLKIDTSLRYLKWFLPIRNMWIRCRMSWIWCAECPIYPISTWKDLWFRKTLKWSDLLLSIIKRKGLEQNQRMKYRFSTIFLSQRNRRFGLEILRNAERYCWRMPSDKRFRSWRLSVNRTCLYSR